MTVGFPCLACGIELFRNEGGLFLCLNRDCPNPYRGYTSPLNFQPPPQPSEERREGKPGLPLTSGQSYREVLGKTLGIGERKVYRLLETLGNVQVESLPFGVKVTVEPGAGVQRIPVPPKTESVDGQCITQICCSGLNNHVFLKVPANCSGNPIILTCHFSD